MVEHALQLQLVVRQSSYEDRLCATVATYSAFLRSILRVVPGSFIAAFKSVQVLQLPLQLNYNLLDDSS